MSGAQFAWHSIELFILAKEEWIVWLKESSAHYPFATSRSYPAPSFAAASRQSRATAGEVATSREAAVGAREAAAWEPDSPGEAVDQWGSEVGLLRAASDLWLIHQSFPLKHCWYVGGGLSAATQEVAVWEVASPWFRGLYQSGTRGQLHRLRYKT